MRRAAATLLIALAFTAPAAAQSARPAPRAALDGLDAVIESAPR